MCDTQKVERLEAELKLQRQRAEEATAEVKLLADVAKMQRQRADKAIGNLARLAAALTDELVHAYSTGYQCSRCWGPGASQRERVTHTPACSLYSEQGAAGEQGGRAMKKDDLKDAALHGEEISEEVEQAFEDLQAGRERHLYDVSLRTVDQLERPGPLSVRQQLTSKESALIAAALDEYGIENAQVAFTHSPLCSCGTARAEPTTEGGAVNI